MRVYLVGGAVRDEIMGTPCVDRDWVVVGSSTEEMLGLGYKQVGADFPVFLHPTTGEEYALARTERKSGAGYLGFEVITDAGTLNPELLAKFEALGYNRDKEYSIDELMAVFQRINL